MKRQAVFANLQNSALLLFAFFENIRAVSKPNVHYKSYNFDHQTGIGFFHQNFKKKLFDTEGNDLPVNNTD
jgi:hypothetical protein